jgi:heat shock protein 5
MVVLGIDLGTTHCCMAVYENNETNIIVNPLGKRTTPSWLANIDGETVIGETARDWYRNQPNDTVYDVKRFIGGKTNNRQILKDLSSAPFQTKNDNNKNIMIKFKEEYYYPEELSGMLLKHLKKYAEDFIGKPINQAVITVPAYFNEEQRKNTQEAGALAEIEVKRIINEPTAAALAYGIDKKQDEGYIMVYDMGGGTLDVTLMDINRGIFTVITTAGDPHLGGEDFNNRLKDYVMATFVKKKILNKYFEEKNSEIINQILEKLNLNSILDFLDFSLEKLGQYKQLTFDKDLNPLYTELVNDLEKALNFKYNNKVISKIRNECERAKHDLSLNTRTTFFVEALYQGEDYHMEISRRRFEALCEPEFNRCLKPIEQVINDAKHKIDINLDEIKNVILVGGSTRVPRIINMLKEKFPNKINNSIDPDYTVAVGAAIQGAVLDDEKTSDLEDIVLVDVVSHSIGIEVDDGDMEFMIERNTPIPTKKTKVFSTCFDNQPSININVYEGESIFTRKNNFLGGYIVKNIPASQAGYPKFYITIGIDHNGVLSVNFKEDELNIKGSKMLEQSDISQLDDSEDIEDETLKIKKIRREILNYIAQINSKMSEIKNGYQINDYLVKARKLISIKNLNDLENQWMEMKDKINNLLK